MVAVLHAHNVVTETDVDVAFARANAALTEALTVLGAFDAQGGWEIAGASSAVSWLAGRGHCTRSEAAVHVRNARLMRDHTEINEAINHGAITPSHTTQLSAIARHRSHKFNDDVADLVEIAGQMSPEAFRAPARYWRTLADDLLAPDERDEPNMVDLAETYNGTWVLHATFDAVRGAALHGLILERSAPTGLDDTRSASQRRADALFALVSGDEPVQVRVDVIVDVDTFIGTTRPVDEIRCELRGVGAIDRVLMERLACTPHIGRVLTRGRSEILNLGRQVRIATPAQRRAVITRDQGCVWPNCKRPPAMCEIHHRTPWQHGGHSNLDNLALLCGHHHTRVHQGWNLTTHPDGTWDARGP